MWLVKTFEKHAKNTGIFFCMFSAETCRSFVSSMFLIETCVRYAVIILLSKPNLLYAMYVPCYMVKHAKDMLGMWFHHVFYHDFEKYTLKTCIEHTRKMDNSWFLVNVAQTNTHTYISHVLVINMYGICRCVFSPCFHHVSAKLTVKTCIVRGNLRSGEGV